MPCLHLYLATHLGGHRQAQQGHKLLLRLPNVAIRHEIHRSQVPDNIMMIIISLLGEYRGLPDHYMYCQGGELHLYGPLQLPPRPELR